MRDITGFTDLLFADQSLAQLLTSTHSAADSKEGAWPLLAEAAENIRAAKPDRAIELLLEITAKPDIATRILLWSWTALRSLGVRPDSETASESKAIVIQVPVGQGIDVLAGYADGTARYVNHSGKIIVWDLPDAVISDLIRKLLKCSVILQSLSPNLGGRSLSDVVRVTVLTCDGNHTVEAPMQSLASGPLNQLLVMSAELMTTLIKRTEVMNQLMKQSPKNGA
jgi:hypothetical protein